MSKLKCPDIDYEKEAEILKALGHPKRLRIAAGISCNNCSVNDMVDYLGLPQSTVSQHLGVLRHAGVIRPEKHGFSVCYRVMDDKVMKMIELFTQMKREG